MAGKFEREKFSNIDINDPFFDSLKLDYPDNNNSTGFTQWFLKKSKQGKEALIFRDKNGIGAFICLKKEKPEKILLREGNHLPSKCRFKISTIKIDDRLRNQRIGEGAFGLILWEWQKSQIDEIYATVFSKHSLLISLFENFGFENVGVNKNGEQIYLRSRKKIMFNDPCKSFPFISSLNNNIGCIPIDMEYHDTMFAYSELANTLQQSVDTSVANGLKKIYIGGAYNLGFNEGDPVLVYRKYTGHNGRPGFKSCITSYCICNQIKWIIKNGKQEESFNEFLKLIGNKTVFNHEQLTEKYNSMKTLVVIELVYYGYFGAGNNVNWVWLKNNGFFGKEYPISMHYDLESFKTILRQGNIDVNNVIIDKTAICK